MDSELLLQNFIEYFPDCLSELSCMLLGPFRLLLETAVHREID